MGSIAKYDFAISLVVNNLTIETINLRIVTSQICEKMATLEISLKFFDARF